MCVTLIAVVLLGATFLWPVGVVAAAGSEALEEAPVEEVAAAVEGAEVAEAVEGAAVVEVAGVVVPGEDGSGGEGGGGGQVRVMAPDVPTLIADAAERWGLAPERMLRIAWCESRWNPGARSPAGHAGLFQFAGTTWRWASTAAGYGGASPYDAAANVESAAWLMATDGFHHWGCR